MADVALQSYASPSLRIRVDLLPCVCHLRLQAALHRRGVPNAEAECRGLLWTAAHPHRSTQAEGETRTQKNPHAARRHGEKLCAVKWSAPRLDVNPSPGSNQTGRLSPNARGMFNLPIANQRFTSAPSNLGQAGEGV